LILYVDTSALVKLVLVEQDSDLAAELGLRSVLYEQSLAKFKKTFEQLLSIDVDERLALSAGERASGFRLRGADAVHLATALDLADEEVTFVTWDQDLADAAASAGLAVAGAPV
jgi:predicted nucleic acid-binding protein